MNLNYTHIVFVLDESGSMQRTLTSTISSFNELLDSQKRLEGKATASLWKFSDYVHDVYQAMDVKEARPLNIVDYRPVGSTALYDAICKAVDSEGERLALLPQNERPGKVVFAILTDGEENASRQHDSSDVQRRIKHQRDVYEWEFVFIGANQDALVTGSRLGVHAANTLTYSHDAAGTQAALRAFTDNLGAYRTGAVASMAFSAEQRDQQVLPTLDLNPTP